jgi:hypothetical protein
MTKETPPGPKDAMPAIGVTRGAIDFLTQILQAPTWPKNDGEKWLAGQIIEEQLQCVHDAPRPRDPKAATSEENARYRAWADAREPIVLTHRQFDVCRLCIEAMKKDLPQGRYQNDLIRLFRLIPAGFE